MGIERVKISSTGEFRSKDLCHKDVSRSKYQMKTAYTSLVPHAFLDFCLHNWFEPSPPRQQAPRSSYKSPAPVTSYSHNSGHNSGLPFGCCATLTANYPEKSRIHSTCGTRLRRPHISVISECSAAPSGIFLMWWTDVTDRVYRIKHRKADPTC